MKIQSSAANPLRPKLALTPWIVFLILSAVSPSYSSENCSPIFSTQDQTLMARACQLSLDVIRIDIAPKGASWHHPSHMMAPQGADQIINPPWPTPSPSTVDPIHSEFSGPQPGTPGLNSLCLNLSRVSFTPITEEVCISRDSQQEVVISLRGQEIRNLYGLGEKFLPTSQFKGDWKGQVRESAIEVGNAMEGFEGGGVANALFPVLYALGEAKSHYILLLDQPGPSKWNLSQTPFQISTRQDKTSLYFISAESPLKSRQQLMSLTGRPPVPPKNAFGFWLSEFGYRSWSEIEDKLNTLRKNRFPIDGMVLDAYWYGPVETNGKKNNFGRMEFDPQYFPNPRENLRRLYEQRKIEVMTHEATYVSQNLSVFDWFSSLGGLVRLCETCGPMVLDNYLGPSSFIDFTNAVTSAAWHKAKRLPLTELGIRFHWTDFTEFDGYAGQDWYSGFGGPSHSARDNHNLISIGWAKSIADGYEQSQYKDLRHFIMTRSGIPGIQRYGAALWSGDTGSNFETLAAQVNTQVGLELSGVDYFGGDIGGYHRIAQKPTESIDDLYTKWFAHAAVLDVPVRPHTNNWNRVYQTAPDRIGSLEANRRNLRLRYELSPYYYSLSFAAYRHGLPIIAPAALYLPEDLKLRQNLETRMIGPYLATVTAPYPGEVSRSIYLPEGSWLEYSTLQSVPGSTDIQWKFGGPGNFSLPIFMKAGAIIPMLWVDDWLLNILGEREGGAPIQDLNVTIYPAPKSSEFELYEDDGKSQQYKSGSYRLTRIQQVQTPNEIRIEIKAQGTYSGAPAARTSVLRVITAGKPVIGVRVNDQVIPYFVTKDEFEKAPFGYTYLAPTKLLLRCPVQSVSVAQVVKILN